MADKQKAKVTIPVTIEFEEPPPPPDDALWWALWGLVLAAAFVLLGGRT